MPLPKPRDDEEQDKFISRCMSAIKDEFPDNDQRLAVCFSQWKKKGESKSEEVSHSEIERRMCPVQELRVDGDKSPRLIGHAAVFDTFTEIGFFGFTFKEKIQKGAFTDSIKNDDIRMLWNHNPDYVLARNRSGTLMLSEDDKGLYFEAVPPDTQWARDLVTSIKRGDVSQNSFGFVINENGEEWNKKQDERTLTSVKLFDVSPVTYPAYPQTDVFVRSKGNIFVSGLDKIFHVSEPDPLVVVDKEHNSQQKIVEPNPSPLVTPELEAKLTELMKIGRKKK